MGIFERRILLEPFGDGEQLRERCPNVDSKSMRRVQLGHNTYVCESDIITNTVARSFLDKMVVDDLQFGLVVEHGPFRFCRVSRQLANSLCYR